MEEMKVDKKRIRQICKTLSEGGDVVETIQSADPPLTIDDASAILACCDPNTMRYKSFKKLIRVTRDFGAEFDKRQFKLRFIDHDLRQLTRSTAEVTAKTTDAVRCWKLIIKIQTQSSLSSRKRWINKLSKLAYGGSYRVACELLRLGKSSDFELTPDEATNILDCCGPDIRYSFCKRLLRHGAKFNDDIVKKASEFLELFTNSVTTSVDGSSDSAADDFKQDSLAGWKLVSKFLHV